MFNKSQTQLAVYNPGPQRNLPAEYQRQGVAIGDVMTVTPKGIFDFFFNIYLPADYPINANNVPEDFVPLSLYDLEDIVHHDFDPRYCVSSLSVQINGDFSEQVPHKDEVSSASKFYSRD